MSVPSKLIEQRPDVRQAEENLHAASAAVGVAIADMLPQFAINADLGSSALTVGRLFSPYTGFWDAGASLTQTLFDAGALLHKKRAADAALDQAGAQYRAAVILACQNVADTLRALDADADALRASADAESAARRTWELAQRQRELGTISLVAVLNAELTLAQAELAVSQAQANRFSDSADCFSRSAADGGIDGRSLTMSNLVLRENKSGAAILTLNRPEKLNALTKEVFEESRGARGRDRPRDPQHRTGDLARRGCEFLRRLRHA